MAEDNPTFTVKAPGFNTWGNVGISKDNDFYKLLDETKEKTDAVFEVVNLVFDLVNSALDFIASLLIDFTNPLKPIIEAIIAFLDSFISDLRNFGWYLTYDKVKNPTEDLLGGYPAFESRIIEKLLNIKDPTRPNFSPESKVFAMTFFAGADASKLGAIISAIKKLLKLFLTLKGPSDKAAAPINVEVGYYNDVVGSIEIPNVYKPDGVRVKWNLPPPPSTNKILPKTFILPDYFLFSVATRQATERIAYINRKFREPYDLVGIDLFGAEKSTAQDFTGGITDPRLWPLIKTDAELTKLDESEELEPLDKMPDGIGTLGSFVLKGEDDYYLNTIDGQKISDVYRCFIYGGGGGALFGDNDFSFDIPLENLKINDNLASEYFITMYSLTMESNDYDSISKNTKDLPSGGLNIRVGTHELLEKGDFITTGRVGETSFNLAMPKGELSKPSATVVVKSPSEIREKYLKAVKFYFLAHLLAQPYIESHKAKLGYENPVGKEETLLKEFAESIEGKNLHQNKQDSEAFALGIQEWLRKIMIRFKEGMPSDATLRSLSNSLDKILSFPLDLEMLVKNELEGDHDDLDLYPERGVVPESIKNIEIEQELINSNYDGVAKLMYAGTKAKYKASHFIHDKWEHKKHPVIFDTRGFIGHLIFHKEFRETFRLAQRVVTLSPPSVGGGEWLNQRPFRDSDLSALTNFIDTVKKYMEGFLKGLEGIVAQILKFIHMLKTRIAQVQAIIARIKALIDLILSFRFPAGLYGTFHLADGTAGLISALQQSEDKPDIGTSGYGTGVMVVAGGVPTILIDFLIALMGGEGEE